MADPSDIEEQFEHLSEEVIREYEDDLTRVNSQRAYAQESIDRRQQDLRARLDLAGVEMDRIAELDRRDDELLDSYLEYARPSLVNREVTKTRHEALSYEALSNDCGAIVTQPYAGVILASDAEAIEGIQGEAGNPWIRPDNPADVNIWRWSRGGGIGNCGGGPDWTIDNTSVYDVWFQFVPDRTAMWELTVLISYTGFWILRANDGFFSCKYSGVRLETTLRVYQYFWSSPERLVLISEEDDNVQRSELFDRTPFQWTRMRLRAGDRVWVRARIELTAYAHGGGSHAELNFSDGRANKIKPWLLSAGAV